jgi:hypothetical protein
VSVTVRDPAGLSATATTAATVLNVNPIAVLHAPSSVLEGSSFTIALTAPFDAGQADQLAGFTFALDCGSGFGAFGASPSAACGGTNDGPRTVRGRIRDKDGGTTEYTAAVNVANVAPAVSIVNAVTSILQGELFSASGSFTDPGPDSWSASVSYEGTAQPVALSGKTFTLSHRYATPGTFTVVVTIHDGTSAGSASVAVHVMSLAEALAAIGVYIRANVGANESRALLASLEAAIASLDRGNPTAAKNQLDALLSKLSAFVRTGQVSATIGTELEGKIRKVLAAI